MFSRAKPPKIAKITKKFLNPWNFEGFWQKPSKFQGFCHFPDFQGGKGARGTRYSLLHLFRPGHSFASEAFPFPCISIISRISVIFHKQKVSSGSWLSYLRRGPQFLALISATQPKISIPVLCCFFSRTSAVKPDKHNKSKKTPDFFFVRLNNHK